MIILISPAKTFNKDFEFSQDKMFFPEKVEYLLSSLKKLDLDEIKSLMKISDKLAKNTFDYYQNFNLNIKAISLYGGQVFKYLNYREISNLNNLYILSPLYGIINSNTAISKYRLDLKDKIINDSLVKYWYDDINQFLNKFKDKIIINLSSGEFSNLIDLKNSNIYSLNFYLKDNNQLKAPSMEIKKIRGLFANYILKNELKSLNQLKTININGFGFNKGLSSKHEYIYIKEL